MRWASVKRRPGSCGQALRNRYVRLVRASIEQQTVFLDNEQARTGTEKCLRHVRSLLGEPGPQAGFPAAQNKSMTGLP